MKIRFSLLGIYENELVCWTTPKAAIELETSLRLSLRLLPVFDPTKKVSGFRWNFFWVRIIAQYSSCTSLALASFGNHGLLKKLSLSMILPPREFHHWAIDAPYFIREYCTQRWYFVTYQMISSSPHYYKFKIRSISKTRWQSGDEKMWKLDS